MSTTTLLRGRVLPSSRGRTTARRYLAAGAFLLPFVVGIAMFQYWPIVDMVLNSFRQFSFLGGQSSSVGWSNYSQLAHDPQFQKAIEVTLLFAVGVVVLVIPCGLGLAMFLNQRFRGARLLRVFAFSPVVTSVVVVAVVWQLLLDPANGLFNTTLSAVGIPRQPFLTSSSQALPSIIAMTVWQQVGLSMILFLSGLQGIPGELLEAAQVDGASWWQRLRWVTLPQLRRTTIFVAFVMTIFSIQAFAPAYVMTHGGPASATLLIVYYLYQTAFTFFQPGYASAIATVLLAAFVVIGLTQILVVRALRR